MSLILEALKKSEARRRLGNAPDLGTPFATAKPRRGLLPYFVIAIAIAAGGGWWMLHKRATPVAPVTTKATPAQHTPAPKSAPAPALHSISGATHGSGTDASAAPHEPSIWVATQRPSDRPGWRDNRAARQGRRNTETTASSAYTSAPTVGPAQASLAHTPTPTAAPHLPIAHEGSQTPKATSQRIAAAHPPQMPTQHAPQTPSQPAPTQDNARSAGQIAMIAPANSNQPDPSRMVAGTGSAPTKPALPAEAATAPTDVPPYYQLAFDVRKALPALKLSMHVYSADPAARFVILNDSRMTEGEKTPDDVTLEKIVPDGVILEFQGHRFFYPRDAL